MMELVKRHLFLAILIGAVVVLSLAAGLSPYLLWTSPGGGERALLRSTLGRAKELLEGTIYTDSLVAEMAKQVDLRKKQYVDVMEYIRKRGADRQPLVANLFPVSTDINLRHSFKAEYDAALAGFMKRLRAVPPPSTEERRGEPGVPTPAADVPEGLMHVHPQVTFFRPDWVDRQEAPILDLCRLGQENIWLQEDLVGVIEEMCKALVDPNKKRVTLADSPIKELVEIRIGAEYAVLAGSRMPSGTGRYRTAERSGGRPPTLTGLTSDPGFYLVLPFRLVVIIEDRYVGELLRRLKGTESFLTIDAWRAKFITDGSFERGREMMALQRDVYGPQGVVRLELTGESLVFQLPGGRVTTPLRAAPVEPTPKPAEAPETPG